MAESLDDCLQNAATQADSGEFAQLLKDFHYSDLLSTPRCPVRHPARAGIACRRRGPAVAADRIGHDAFSAPRREPWTIGREYRPIPAIGSREWRRRVGRDARPCCARGRHASRGRTACKKGGSPPCAGTTGSLERKHRKTRGARTDRLASVGASPECRGRAARAGCAYALRRRRPSAAAPRPSRVRLAGSGAGGGSGPLEKGTRFTLSITGPV